MKNYFEKRLTLIKIHLFSIAKINKLNEAYELLEIWNCQVCLVRRWVSIYGNIYVLLPTKVQYTIISYLVEKDTTITEHVPTSKAVCSINNYVISVIIFSIENKLTTTTAKMGNLKFYFTFSRILPHNIQSILWFQFEMMLQHIDRGVNPDLEKKNRFIDHIYKRYESIVKRMKDSLHGTIVYLRPASSCCRFDLRLPNICFSVYDLERKANRQRV